MDRLGAGSVSDGCSLPVEVRAGQYVTYRSQDRQQNPEVKRIRRITRLKALVHVFPAAEGARGTLHVGRQAFPALDLGPKSGTAAPKRADRTCIAVFQRSVEMDRATMGAGRGIACSAPQRTGAGSDLPVRMSSHDRPGDRAIALLHVERVSPRISVRQRPADMDQDQRRTRQKLDQLVSIKVDA